MKLHDHEHGDGLAQTLMLVAMGREPRTSDGLVSRELISSSLPTYRWCWNWLLNHGYGEAGTSPDQRQITPAGILALVQWADECDHVSAVVAPIVKHWARTRTRPEARHDELPDYNRNPW